MSENFKNFELNDEDLDKVSGGNDESLGKAKYVENESVFLDSLVTLILGSKTLQLSQMGPLNVFIKCLMVIIMIFIMAI